MQSEVELERTDRDDELDPAPPSPQSTLPAHRKRTKVTKDDSEQSQRAGALSRIADVLGQQPDECATFGKLVECRMRRIPRPLHGLFEVQVLNFMNQFEEEFVENS